MTHADDARGCCIAAGKHKCCERDRHRECSFDTMADKITRDDRAGMTADGGPGSAFFRGERGKAGGGSDDAGIRLWGMSKGSSLSSYKPCNRVDRKSVV